MVFRFLCVHLRMSVDVGSSLWLFVDVCGYPCLVMDIYDR